MVSSSIATAILVGYQNDAPILIHIHAHIMQVSLECVHLFSLREIYLCLIKHC